MFRERRTPSTPDIEGLRKFSEQDDRSPAPVFVGRDGALADVEGVVRRVAAGDAQGGIRLVYGAPGAGKSALLEEIAKRWQSREDSDAPTPLFVSADDFAEPALVAEAILDALNPGATPFSASSRRTEWSAQAGFLSRHVETETSRSSPLAEVSGGRRNPWAMLREFAPSQDWPGPVILLIDEAQGMTGDMSNGESSLLKALHEGRHGFLLTAVLSGLSDTLQVLRDLGVSRLSEGATHALGPLSGSECREAVAALLDRHGVKGGAENRAEWAGAIAERCNGWPQHLHNYLAGAARSLVDAGGDLARAELNAALEHGDRARVNYYNARLAGLAPAHSAIRSILSRIPDGGLLTGEVMAMAQRVATPAGFDNGPQFYKALLHAGVLHEDGALMCHCPIPSFRSHILDTLSAACGLPLDP